MSKEDKKKSEDTTGKLTTKSAFLHQSDTTPTAQEMIDQIRIELALRMEDLWKFEKFIKNMPNGCVLKPVLYKKVDVKQNKEIFDEFITKVRGNFFRFLTNNHSEKLFALGLSDYSIEQMKNGNVPVDKDGVLYYSVDHIVERSGSGEILLRNVVDPLMPPDSEPTLLVNHFGNLILLPDIVHKAKNWLLNLQNVSMIKNGRRKLVLTMVPETTSGQYNFVATQQESNHYLYNLISHPQKSKTLTMLANNRAYETIAAIRELRSNPNFNEILTKAKAKAARYGGSVVECMMWEKKHPTAAPQNLDKDFNRAVAYNPVQQEFLENFLLPLMEETTKKIRAAYEVSMKDTESPVGVNRFVQVFHAERITNLRNEIENLPIPEAVKMQQTMMKIKKALFAQASIQSRKGISLSTLPKL